MQLKSLVRMNESSSIDAYMQALKVLAGHKSFNVHSNNILSSSGLSDNFGKEKNRRNRFRKLNRSRSGADGQIFREKKSEVVPFKSFWGYVEDYFRDITQEDIMFLRSMVCHEYDPVFQIPPVGKISEKAFEQNSTNKDTPTTEIEGSVLSSPKRKMIMPNLLKKKRVKSMPLASGSSDPNLIDSSNEDCISSHKPAPVTIVSPPEEEEDEELCDVCYSGYSIEGDVIIFCDSCDVAVHQQCYGISQIPEGDWFCDRCILKSQEDIECILCPEKGGAMKPIAIENHSKSMNDIDPLSLVKYPSNSKHPMAHLFCSQWIPETFIEDTLAMQPILNIEGIRKERWRLACSLCKKRKGACIQCSYGHCAVAFHPLCARKCNLLMMISSKESGDGQHNFEAFCEKHSKIQKMKMKEFNKNRNGENTVNKEGEEGEGEACEEDSVKSMEVDDCVLVKESNVKRHLPSDTCLTVNGQDAIHTHDHSLRHENKQFKKQKMNLLPSSPSTYSIKPNNSLKNTDKCLLKAQHDESLCNVNLNPMDERSAKEGKEDVFVHANLINGGLNGKMQSNLHESQVRNDPSLEKDGGEEEEKGDMEEKRKDGLQLSFPSNSYKRCDEEVTREGHESESNEKMEVYKDNSYLSHCLYSLLSKVLWKNESCSLQRHSPMYCNAHDLNAKLCEEMSFTESASILKNEYLKQKNDDQNDEKALSNVLHHYFPSLSPPLKKHFHSPWPNSLFTMDALNGMKVEEEWSGNCENKHSFQAKEKEEEEEEKKENVKKEKENVKKEANVVYGDDSLSEQLKKIELAKEMGMDALFPKDELESEILIQQAQLFPLIPFNRSHLDDLMMNILPSLENQRVKESKRIEDKHVIDLYKSKKRELNRQNLKERREKEAHQSMTAAKAAIEFSSRPVHLRRTITLPRSHPLSQKDYLTDLTPILSPPHSSDLSPHTSPHLYHPSPSSSLLMEFPSPKVRSRATANKPMSTKLAKATRTSDLGSVSKPTSLRILGPTPPLLGREEDAIVTSPSLNDAMDEGKASAVSVPCAICGNSMSTNSNEIVTCMNCKTSVHQNCYGVISSSSFNHWLCQVCDRLQREEKRDASPHSLPLLPTLTSAASATCFLCSSKGGAMKVSVDDHFVHVICVQWFPEANLGKDENDFVGGLDKIPKEKFGLTCLLCNKQDGACINCNFGRCTKTFHVTCAFSFGLFMPSKLFANGKYSRRAYCEKHSTIQRERIETKRIDGFEDLTNLRVIRANLERFRSICILVNRRERKKKEITDCLKDIAFEKLKSQSILRQGSLTLTDLSMSSQHNFSPNLEHSVSQDTTPSSAKRRKARNRPSFRKLQNLTALSSDSSFPEPSLAASEVHYQNAEKTLSKGNCKVDDPEIPKKRKKTKT